MRRRNRGALDGLAGDHLRSHRRHRATSERRSEPQRAAGTVQEGVHAVLVDVVVRDKRGQPVRDLTEADFEVLEDGVPQTIGSFTPMFEGACRREHAGRLPPPAPAAAAAAGATPASPADGGPGGHRARLRSARAPRARRSPCRRRRRYLGDKEEMPNYIGIFGIDLSLTPLAPFTRNGACCRQALEPDGDGAASAGFNTPEMQQQRRDAEAAATSADQTPPTAPRPRAGAGHRGAVGTAAGDAMLAQMESSMVPRTSRRWSATSPATRRPTALFAIISTLGRLPGRKSVDPLFRRHCDPDRRAAAVLGVIDAANRANVSIYTMDAAGLRAESEQAQDPRHGERGRRRRRAAAIRRTAVADAYTQGAREATKTCCAAIPRHWPRAAGARAPAVMPSTTPTTSSRRSTGSRAISATTTCSATRRSTTRSTGSSGR